MKIYNVAGWALVLAYALACMYFAPPDIGPWTGLLSARPTSWCAGSSAACTCPA